MSFQPARPSSVLASVLAAAGIMLTAASCSHVTPLGPDPAVTPAPPHAAGQSAVAVAPPVLVPPPRQLGSAIILQVMRSHPAPAPGRCPAGYIAISAPGSAGTCYRKLGTPVTITSAAVSAVSAYRQPPQPGQPAPPTQYGFTVAVPSSDVAAVTALIRQAYDARGALAVNVDGKTWSAPQVDSPFPGGQLQIALPSRNQALSLHRILVPTS
jgi:hypothetical protein